MGAVQGLIAGLESVNTFLLRIGRTIAWISVALMVVIILLQVFFRYVLNSALPWPEEAARVLMLWMTGMMAPSAYRWGAFVSIDMLKEMLGQRVTVIFNIFLLMVGLVVLVIALYFGWKHIQSGWLFMSPTIKLPMPPTGQMVQLPKAYIFMSLPVGFLLMVSVNIELMLKNLYMLFDPSADYSQAPDQSAIAAE